MRRIWYTCTKNVFLIRSMIVIENTFISLTVSCSHCTGLSGGTNRNLTGFVPVRFLVESLVDRVVLGNVFYKVLSLAVSVFPPMLRKHSLSHSSSHHRRCLILVVRTSFSNTCKNRRADAQCPDIVYHS